jgi:hypothetical protein
MYLGSKESTGDGGQSRERLKREEAGLPEKCFAISTDG